MDGPQGPHQPTPTSWMYMQHLLQQLQDHQQPQQQPPPPSPSMQQHQLPHQPPHQQPPLPPPPTPPHHHQQHQHHHHQPILQHHQPLQMQQLPPPPLPPLPSPLPLPPPPPSSPPRHQQQYQPLQQQQQQQQQQQYKPPPPPPPPQQTSKTFLRADDHSYSVESLLGGSRVDLPPAPMHPMPLHPTRVHSIPLPPGKVQPDNEMMVMSFLNELEGGKKMQGGSSSSGSGGPAPSTQHKTLPSSRTPGFPEVLIGEEQSPTPLLAQSHSLALHTPHQSTATTTTATATTTTTTAASRVNHDGDARPLPVRTALTAAVATQASSPQEAVSLNPLYSGPCEVGGASLARLEQGDSTASMSHLDLGLSDDSNPLIDQLESALEGDCSLQTKTSPECPLPSDASSCPNTAGAEGEAVRETSAQPQTDMLVSLLDNPSSQTSSHRPEHAQPSVPPAPSEEQPKGQQATDLTAPQDTQEEVQGQVALPSHPRRPSQDTEKENGEVVPTDASEEAAAPCTPRTSSPDTQTKDSTPTPAATQDTALHVFVAASEHTRGRESEVTPTHAQKEAVEPSEDTGDAAPRCSGGAAPHEDSQKQKTTPATDDAPQEVLPHPNDTQETSRDLQLTGEAAPEEPQQPATDRQPPSKNSSEARDSPSPPVLHLPSDEESAIEEPTVLPPKPMSEAADVLVDIPTVYIIEPKQEAVVDVPSEPSPEVVFVGSEKAGEEGHGKDGEKRKETTTTMKVLEKREKTHFFEKTPVPKETEKATVTCFVCDSSVAIAKVKNHLFFGFVQCTYCNRRLMGCRLLKEDLNNSDKKICFSSPFKEHNFSKWAGDPIEHLSYYIRKDLVIKRFCAGETNPPPVPEIVAGIQTYIGKLSLLEAFAPWSHAFERCRKYIHERLSTESRASGHVRHVPQPSSRSSSPLVIEGTTSLSGQGRGSASATLPFAGKKALAGEGVGAPSPVTGQAPSPKAVPVARAANAGKPDARPGSAAAPSPGTQSGESADDPAEVPGHRRSDAADDGPATPLDTAPSGTPLLSATLSGLAKCQGSSGQQTPDSASKPSFDALNIKQTINKLQEMLGTSPAPSRVSSPSLSTPRRSKTNTPEAAPATPAGQSDTEAADGPASTVFRQNSAGTTLVRQWGTKAKVRHSGVRKASRAESWPVKDENYLIVKYPSEPCPNACPSCYTTFDPLQATVQCSSFLITVKCESCKLTLFVSQDPVSSHPRKRRKL